MPFDPVQITKEQVLELRASARRRAAVRYKCGPATPGRVQLEGQIWQRAWVLNVSLGGAGLLLGCSVESGTEVVLSLNGFESKLTLQVHATVCHATQQVDGDWVIGCRFDNPLNDEQLDSLLQ